ncbi:hypothetical protein CWR48_06045 [Oceanobacillus arenosus]|uniref:Phosphoribulokinase/uridine kinase domain-containing protein n=1 Tax=Oceanobacillus arenosus TaxID=1229153 RepID=A0A3D8PYB0_9BACI|nr:AAA family ATPase [Oceanobacillus arenosus]RDW20258.1 hypothetical protein CWR48_06045 [Oceanobacillus arenosus]
MGNKKPPIVISIAGVSGGGKTTIAKSLNEKLHNSKILYFDDYDFEGPDDIIEWVDNGANYDQWNLEPLITDLEVLLAEPLDHIVLDLPFAYKHAKISKLIDFAVYIDTPLDIAMARRIIRDFKNYSGESILIEMENYLSAGRRGYLEMLKSIKPNSDMIEDGSQSVSEITDNICTAILRR